MEPSRIQAVSHVELEAAPEAEAELRWFYGELAGLDPIGFETDTQLLRFRSARIELRIRFVSSPKNDPVPVRVTISVRSLMETAAALDEAGIGYERVSGLLFTDRLLCVVDPGGNRVAFRQVWVFGTL
jgi:hypothetical protein